VANTFRDLADVGRVIRAARYALAGLKAAYNHEAAFRQELALFMVLAPLGAWLGRDGVERALLIGSLVLVLVAELLNSAIEAAVNRVGTEPHELSGRAKDIASAAVLLTILLVFVVWTAILVGRI
jgi:diacylglycerol kinase (ATP)